MSALESLLQLPTYLYKGIVRVRNAAYDHRLLPVFETKIPVISVGNVTTGGNAKTPLAHYIISTFTKRGYRPIVLSRGYGGSSNKPHLVSPTDSPKLVGDEPAMLVRNYKVPVVIAQDRVAGAKMIEDQDLANMIVLDDGFQHRRLARQVDIVTIDISTKKAQEDFIAGHLLPRGRFREPRDLALKRAKIIVLATRQPPKEDLQVLSTFKEVLPTDTHIFHSFLEIEGIYSLQHGTKLPIQEAIIFCAIANPLGFAATVVAAGIKVRGAHYYNDHQKYSEKALNELRRRYPGVPLLCTAKDAVKIDSAWAENIYVVNTILNIKPETEFINLVIKLIS